MTVRKWSTHGRMPALGEQLPSSEDATPSNVEADYQVGADQGGEGEDQTVEQIFDMDPEYVPPAQSVQVATIDAPTTPPKLGTLVNFVHDPTKILVAKVVGVLWGKHRQLDLEATIPVEKREHLQGLDGIEQTRAVGTRRRYRVIAPDEAEELAAAQQGLEMEPTVEDDGVETGITYIDKLVRFPKVRWEARGERGRGVAGTWHEREDD